MSSPPIVLRRRTEAAARCEPIDGCRESLHAVNPVHTHARSSPARLACNSFLSPFESGRSLLRCWAAELIVVASAQVSGRGDRRDGVKRCLLTPAICPTAPLVSQMQVDLAVGS